VETANGQMVRTSISSTNRTLDTGLYNIHCNLYRGIIMGDKTEHEIWLDEYNNSIGNITVDTSDMNTQQWDDWIQQYTGELDLDIGNYYSDSRLGANDINLTAGGEEMLRVAEDGFYVRGVRVEADEKEAKAVYEAFKSWMTYAILNGEINNR